MTNRQAAPRKPKASTPTARRDASRSKQSRPGLLGQLGGGRAHARFLPLSQPEVNGFLSDQPATFQLVEMFVVQPTATTPGQFIVVYRV